jgi:hypothetical protein
LLFIFLINKRKRNGRLIFLLCTSNLFIMAQLSLPYSFVSKTPASTVNRQILAYPKGFPTANVTKPIAENSKDAMAHFNQSGPAYFYSKKPSLSKLTISPSFLTQYDKFISSENLYNYVATQPMVYLADTVVSLKDTASLLINSCPVAVVQNKESYPALVCGGSGSVSVNRLSSNSIHMTVRADKASLLVLTQNYHHYWRAEMDEGPVKIIRANMSFMAIPVGPGQQHIRFCFYPEKTIAAIWAQAAAVLLLLIYGGVTLFSRKKAIM